jgi:hypothetical protein
MIVLPPLLPELDGGRLAPGAPAPGAATIQIGARVVAIKGADALIETAHGRGLLQGAPGLRPGVALVLELPHADPALARTGRVVMVGERRLEPGLPVRLQPVPSTEAAATVRAAAALEVSVRPVGPDGRPVAPALSARLSVPAPQSESGSAENSPVLPSGGTAARAGVPPGMSGPASPVPPVDPGSAPVSSRLAPVLGPPIAPGPATAATGPPPAPQAILAQLSVFAAQGQALEAVVLPGDALGRTLLRAAGLTLQVDPSLDLPAGARLHLSLPAGLSLPATPTRSDAAIQTRPLDAVRTLAAWLREEAEAAEPARPGALRLPEPDATLASRLLRLVQLIVPRPGSADVRRAAAPEVREGQPGVVRVTAALAELGRVAGEPQHGGWRVLLLPLAFEGAPLLRLHLREDPSDRDGGGTDDGAGRSDAARRAVFEVEFGALGRCQIDALCQARRFDLLVRTEQPLPPVLRREIRELYVAARDAAGLVGTARFRAGQLLALPEPGGPAGITV